MTVDYTTKMRIAVGTILGSAVAVRVLDSMDIVARKDGGMALVVIWALIFLWLMSGREK